MRIHLSLEPRHFAAQPVAGPSASPLAQLGGDLVLIELQGELGWEGPKEGGVVGVIGLDRPDKPTLHLGEHHLLHGKFVNLPKPLAVIRRVVASTSDISAVEGAVEGDAEEEDDLEEEEEDEEPTGSARKGVKRRKSTVNEEEENEPPLFPEAGPSTHTPARRGRGGPDASSSPFPLEAPSSVKDFSSELDFSSPPASTWEDQDQDEEDEEDGDSPVVQRNGRGSKRGREEQEVKRKSSRPERTRVYEVVGVVRKKVVFALRPEPIVTATVLPE